MLEGLNGCLMHPSPQVYGVSSLILWGTRFYLVETFLCHWKTSLEENTLCHSYKCVFPILVWCQSYTVTKFKNNLLTGLTIASLRISQVNKKFNMEMTIINTIRLEFYLFIYLFFCHIVLMWVSMQSIGYATLAKLDPQYGLCKWLEYDYWMSIIYIH